MNVDIPRDALVVFTGVSGSGKSSLAFGTLYAEAQRRYLESVSPYARRLFHQMAVPDVDSIDGLPPAVALQQQRGSPTTRSSVGSVTTLSNLLRMLYSRAGDYPSHQPLLYAESFSPNTAEGACPRCHGLGRVYEVTERSMVPDDTLSIRQRAVAAWPTAWQGQNLRDILVTLGHDVDRPWRDLPKKTRDWILFTDEQPTVPVYAGYTPAEVRRALKRKEEPSYQGTFTGARRYVLHTFAHSQSALMKKRVSQYMLGADCPVCDGKRLRAETLSVKFAGLDIAEMSRISLQRLALLMRPYATQTAELRMAEEHPEKAIVVQRIAEDLCSRLDVLLDLGLGYLTLERSTPTLSPGELQRLRLATQVHSNLFGVVYVLDEPSAGLHPADTEALLRALDRLQASGNSLFVVEHELDVIRHADWIVDVGPSAGEHGGRILYSGPPDGLKQVEASETRHYLYGCAFARTRALRAPTGWLKLTGVTRNNLRELDVDFPLGVLTAVTGVSGSGKSSLVSQVLVELVAEGIGHTLASEEEVDALENAVPATQGGRISAGIDRIDRLVLVDQKPIGRTPRSNLATYTGLFDQVRKLFAATPAARALNYDAGRFSFNVAKGRCPACEGEGFVMVELLFLASVYAPCPACHGSRYNAKTLEIEYRGKNIADVLGMTVDAAWDFFADEAQLHRQLDIVRQVGLGYLRLGQPATELSGGEAQRIKLATELQRAQRGSSLYILDEPTTGLHPADVERLMAQLDGLVECGNTVILIEHDMRVVAGSDWIIDIGPGAGEDGGKIVATGHPAAVAQATASRTAPYLERFLGWRMKIATFNVNGINGRLPVLLQWLAECRPDIACLQELKAPQERFPAAALRDAGYGAVWHGQSQWNGVAILARGAEPRETHRGLPGDPEDTHSRYIEAAVHGVLVGCLYLPNGNPAPGPKFDYKLRWFDRLAEHALGLLEHAAPIVLAGDYNVMPTDLDVYAPERWRDDALFRPEVRAAYARLLAQGWTDALRTMHPGERIYTFWKYWRNAFGRDAGLRIDHLLLSPVLTRRLTAAGVDREVRAREKASDHAPVWIELADDEPAASKTRSAAAVSR